MLINQVVGDFPVESRVTLIGKDLDGMEESRLLFMFPSFIHYFMDSLLFLPLEAPS